MVIRRSKEDDPKSDVELMEHLVKKSLDVNPHLRSGRRTGEVLRELKEEAVARAQAEQPSASKRQANVSDRRKSTIAFFLEQKAGEFKDQLADITAREKLLQQEKDALKATVADDIADFLALMAGAADSPEAREVLREQRAFLTALGLTDGDVIERARHRAK